jgi:hypothetical protein
MSFINWGHESPEQLAIRQRWEAEMQALFEQAARSRSGQSPFGGAGGSKKPAVPVVPVDPTSNGYVEDGYVEDYFV